MNSIKIKPRLLGAFLVIALIALIIGWRGITAAQVINAGAEDIGKTKLPSINALLVISEAQTAVDSAENALLCTSLTPELEQAQYKRFDDAQERVKIARAIYDPLPQTEEEAQVWKDFVPAWDKWWQDHETYVSLSKAYRANRSDAAYKKMLDQALVVNGETFTKAESLLTKVVDINDKASKEAVLANQKTFTSARMTLIVFMFVGLVLAGILGFVIAASVATPIGELKAVADKLALGDVDVTATSTAKDEIGDLTRAMGMMVANINGSAQVADMIAGGDLSIVAEAKSDKDILAKSMNRVVETLRALVSEAGMLSKAAVDGRLETRGDANKFEGGYREIVKGVNDCLDSVIGPLNVAAEYVERISNGNIPPVITDDYNGDFNEIKNNLNKCIVAVNALVADAKLLAVAAVEGKLETRADATKHHGDFRAIVEGVNGCLDSVIGPLNVAAEYVERISNGNIPPEITDDYHGDFNEIKNNLNKCIVAVNALVSDAKLLAVAAVEGKLETRADATKHQGDFRAVVQGVNDCLDSVIGPLNVAAEYVERISNGNIPPVITDDYNGDFNEIKNNLNKCIVAVNALVSDAKLLSVAAVEGKLETRADATKHQGDFRAVVQGVNE
ncbi:MAG: MCP four helix bundle domain-containing protein, partial [Armatimonadetes bacterium]|nr:MCP four helix bundle domain-containing protein [Armatimonadota bacterium]